MLMALNTRNPGLSPQPLRGGVKAHSVLNRPNRDIVPSSNENG
jgi:hypothetical protein